MWKGVACDNFYVLERASNFRSSVVGEDEVGDIVHEAFSHPHVPVGLVPLFLLE